MKPTSFTRCEGLGNPRSCQHDNDCQRVSAAMALTVCPIQTRLALARPNLPPVNPALLRHGVTLREDILDRAYSLSSVRRHYDPSQGDVTTWLKMPLDQIVRDELF